MIGEQSATRGHRAGTGVGLEKPCHEDVGPWPARDFRGIDRGLDGGRALLGIESGRRIEIAVHHRVVLCAQLGHQFRILRAQARQ